MFYLIQAPSVVKVGDYVAAPFEDDTSWYRGKVMGVKGEELDLFLLIMVTVQGVLSYSGTQCSESWGFCSSTV